MGGEPPTRIRGGAVLGGIGGSRPAEIGPVTEYVLRRAAVPGPGHGAGQRRLARRTAGADRKLADEVGSEGSLPSAE